MAKNTLPSLSSVSVPAKVILFGEHAVVYPGNHAIMWPVKSLQVVTETFKASKVDEYIVTISGETKSIPFFELTSSSLESEDIKGYTKACLAIAHEYVSGVKVPKPLRIEISSNIPIGGFGSSASTAASLIKAIVVANGLTLNQPTWFDLVMQAEKLPHTNPSGADAAVVTMQQPIIVKKRSDGLVDIEAIGDSKELQKTTNEMQFLHTGKPKELTGQVVQFVASRRSSKETLSQIEDNTRQVIDAIRSGSDSLQNYKKWINKNGELLERLGVVPQMIAKKSGELRDQGMSIKLSGAGALSGDCGGVMIYLGSGKPSF